MKGRSLEEIHQDLGSLTKEIGDLLRARRRRRQRARSGQANPSRWQAFVWWDTVLKPMSEAPVETLETILGSERVGRANFDQIGRYFPDFAKAAERCAEDLSQETIDALVSAVWAVHEQLPKPFGHYDLCFAYDEAERRLKAMPGAKEEARP